MSSTRELPEGRATRSDRAVPDAWMERTQELLKAVVVGGQPIAEWEVCLRLLSATENFLRTLGRSGIRLDDDFPESEWQELNDLIADYLYPDDIDAPRPHERLNTVRGIPNDDGTYTSDQEGDR